MYKTTRHIKNSIGKINSIGNESNFGSLKNSDNNTIRIIKKKEYLFSLSLL
tara:strand:- start:951 stop:1103 length:153 start_codon:yes stop_codon:yes gene_type:complete